MKITKLTVQTEADIPVIAALPYSVSFDETDVIEDMTYDAELQLTTYNSGGRDYSTSRDDDSVWTLIPHTTKSDTKKDD